MTPLRDRDRLFLAVAVPAAILAAYIFLWRAPHSAKVRSYREKCGALVHPDDFPAEKRKLEKRLADSAAELEEEKNTPPPESTMKGAAQDSIAMRERAVLEVLREAGLQVVSSDVVEPGAAGGNAQPQRGGDVLRATALRPNPRMRRYRLVGGYAAMRRALEIMAERKCAVIPERLEMDGGDGWTLLLWL